MLLPQLPKFRFSNYFIIFSFLGVFLTPSVIKAQLSISINSGGATSVPTGQDICYDVSYTWSSTTQDLNNAKIELPIPLPLSGDVSGDVGVFNSPHIASSVYNPSTRKITWTMVNPLPAGSSGTVKFCVHFANGTTANGANVTLTPTISGTGVLPASNSVSLTADASPKTTVLKDIKKDPALDNEATYSIVVNNNQGNGNYSLTNAVVTDVLPAGAIFVRASNGGTNSGGTVTWNLGNFAVGAYTTLRLTVKYPTGSFNLGQTVNNTATLTGTTPAGVLPAVSSTKAATIAAPFPEASSAKYSWTDWASLGGGMGFNFYTYNSGNVPLDNYVVEDHIPAEFLLTEIGLGVDDNGTQNSVKVEYKTKNNPIWATFPNSPFTMPASLSAPDRTYLGVWQLGFDPMTGTDYVTDVRLTWDHLPVGYSADNSQTYLNGTTINPNRDGVTYPMPLKIGNTINLQYDYVGNTTVLPPFSDSMYIVGKSPKATVGKSLNSSTTQQPNNEVQYQFCLNNNWDASDSLRDGIVADLLPLNMTIIPGTLVNLSTFVSAPTVNITDNFNGTGRQLLKFSWLGQAMPVSTSNCFTMNAKIKAGTPPGTLRNQLYFLSASNPIINTCDNPQYVRDTFDIDGDGLTLTDTLPTSYDIDINVLETTAIESYKYVKGDCDSTFHRYPEVGKAAANGTFQYKLYVKNTGNQPLTNIRTLDILPWVGDIGVLTYGDSRQTAYQPTFVSMDIVPSGVTVKYSNSSNPCRAGLDAAITEPGSGCDANTFSTTMPTNLADIHSLIFDFGNIVIQPADSLELRWTMRVPYGVGPGEVAWNSFGHRSESTTGTIVPPAEPIKVGVTVKSAKIGDLVWVDTDKDGIFNNGEVGLEGVTVRLLDSLMNPVINPITSQAITDTTDASGNYFFNVAPGTYFVKFDLPAGYATTVGNQGDDTTDSDIASNGKTTTSITVVDGDSDLKWDAGIYVVCPIPPSISSIVVDTATCFSGVANGDAKITLNGITVATTYSYSTVGTSNLLFANATNISGGTIILSNLQAPSVPKTYFFRTYAPDSACYKDTMVILPPSVCPQPPCAMTATATTAACHANGTPENPADDYIIFSINAANTLLNTQTFTVTATQGGSPIVISLANDSAATAVNCGLNTAMKTPVGTAGKGDITLTITDNANNCSTTLNITDAGTCAITCSPGTAQMVMYAYSTQVQTTELENVPVLIPQFDEQGGTRILTKVTLDYSVGSIAHAIFENSAATPATFKATMTSDVLLDLNGNNIATASTSITTGFKTIQPSIIVAAQDNWVGDSTSGGVPSTISRMLTWMNDRMSNMKDPTTDPRYVTHATGNTTTDDDIYYYPVTQDSTNGSLTYTLPADLAPFKGTAKVPLVVSTLSGMSTSGGGGNLSSVQKTKGFAYAKVTYFYECAANCKSPICIPVTVARQ